MTTRQAYLDRVRETLTELAQAVPEDVGHFETTAQTPTGDTLTLTLIQGDARLTEREERDRAILDYIRAAGGRRVLQRELFEALNRTGVAAYSTLKKDLARLAAAGLLASGTRPPYGYVIAAAVREVNHERTA